MALVKPDNSKLDIVSQFQITKGEGPFWAHPVINKGRLYIRLGCELSIESARKNLTDIAGIRVICSYIDDIYLIADLLTAQDDKLKKTC